MAKLLVCGMASILLASWFLLSAKWQRDDILPIDRLVVGMDDLACSGRRVYTYDLPHDFNELIVKQVCDKQSGIEWICSTVVNGGRGLPARSEGRELAELPGVAHKPVAGVMSACKLVPSAAWFKTHQFALELLMHSRMQQYECKSDTPDNAQLEYVPYYAGMDLWRYIFTPQVQLRDRLGQRLVGFLQARGRAFSGPRLLLVLGRIVWDFVRKEHQADGWGSSLLAMPELANATMLLLERGSACTAYDGGHHQMAVPYPTGFHPSSSAQMDEWRAVVAAANPGRSILASFVGSGRPNGSASARLRTELLRQCNAASDADCTLLACDQVDCERNPELVSCLGLGSVFCLMPKGDSATRKGLFDSLLSGCIPVLFSPHSAYTQYLWHLPRNGSSYSVLLPEQEVLDSSLDVIQQLKNIRPERVREMQAAIAELLPGIVYANQRIPPYRDAFDVTMQNVFAS